MIYQNAEKKHTSNEFSKTIKELKKSIEEIEAIITENHRGIGV